MSILRQLTITILIFLAVLIVGITGIRYLENLSWLDSLYFVVVTLTSIGYGDIVPHTKAGRIFTIAFVIIGIVTIGIAFSMFTAVQIKQLWGKARMKNRIEQLSDHIIICGAGRVGGNIIERLKNENQRFIVIENQEEICRSLLDEGVLTIHGDATLDEMLIEGGIQQANGIITALANDADNVYVTLTARSLNPQIKIVSRASRPEAEEKLKRAGAHSVILPSVMGARQMVSSMLQPVLVDFMENVVYNQDLHLDIAEIPIMVHSSLVGLTIRNSGIKETFDAIIVAIKREDRFIVNPGPHETLDARDVLIALGHRDQLLKLVEVAHNK